MTNHLGICTEISPGRMRVKLNAALGNLMSAEDGRMRNDTERV
jgi:hypothetical protein